MNGRITIRLDREQQTALGLLARRHSHSVGAEVRQALRRWIEDAPRRAAADRISRMSLDELNTYLAGVDDGREDERPPREAAVVESPPTETASDGTD